MTDFIENTDELIEEALAVLSGLEEYEELFELIFFTVSMIMITTDSFTLEELKQRLRELIDSAMQEVDRFNSTLSYDEDETQE